MISMEIGHNISEKELQKLAAICARLSRPGDIWSLSGDLGAGKSTFARKFLQNLGVDEDIPSPTFTLVQYYETPKSAAAHADLYRIQRPEDADEIGILEDTAGRVTLIEWPEKLGDRLKKAGFWVRFDFLDDMGKRKVTITANAANAPRLQEIEKKFHGTR